MIMHEVIIIGGGPSSLMCGRILKEYGIDFCILEKGKSYTDRVRDSAYDVSYGIGGAGLYSDGKFSYPPSASWIWHHLEPSKLKRAYENIRTIMNLVGIEILEWNEKWVDRNINYTNGEQKFYESQHIDINKRNALVFSIGQELKDKIITGVNVIGIVNDQGYFNVVSDDGQKYKAKQIVIAVGKSSLPEEIYRSLAIKMQFMAEAGVRIEVPSNTFIPIKYAQLDYKYISHITANTQIRTFCSCKNGSVIESLYNQNSTFNGSSDDVNNSFSNIGIVLRTNTKDSKYYKSIERLIESKKNNKCCLSDYLMSNRSIYGDPIDNEIISVIKKVTTGLSGTIYYPEVEKWGYYPVLKDSLIQKGVYWIGDCTGLFRGLAAAFITGSYVAEEIYYRREKSIAFYMNRLKIKQSSIKPMKMIFTAQSKKDFYCRDVICQFVFSQGKLPVNPFRVFDYFLGDRVSRDIIRRGNNQLLNKCDELWVFGNISDGVLFEIASAIAQRKPIRFFSLGSTTEEIRELDVENLTFEPEVHSKRIKKKDLIDFIRKEGEVKTLEYYQMELNNYYDNS